MNALWAEQMMMNACKVREVIRPSRSGAALIERGQEE